MSKELKYPVPINFNRKLCSAPSGSFKNFILTDCVINPKPIRSVERFPLSLGDWMRVSSPFQARDLLGHKDHSVAAGPQMSP